MLAADEADLAHELDREYGAVVELSVGALSYPVERAAATCVDTPAPSERDDLVIKIVPPKGPLRAGGVFGETLSVTLTNVGDDSIRFSSGAASSVIMDDAGQVVIANVGAFGGVGLEIDLAPGASTELPMSVGTASCVPRLGYVVPPGEYVLVGLVPQAGSNLTTAPLAITVG